MNASAHRSPSTVLRQESRNSGHRIPGLFDFPQAGQRRRCTVLSRFVESLVAPERLVQESPSTLSGVN